MMKITWPSNDVPCLKRLLLAGAHSVGSSRCGATSSGAPGRSAGGSCLCGDLSWL